VKGYFDGDAGYPGFGEHMAQETALARFARMLSFEMTFSKPNAPTETLDFIADCGSAFPNRIWLVPASQLGPEHLDFRCMASKVNLFRDSVKFRSYSDLSGATVTIRLDPENDMPRHSYPQGGMWSGIDLTLKAVLIKVPGRRIVTLDHFADAGWTPWRETGDSSSKTFTTTFLGTL
jgi:hypothetical protein